MKQFDEAFKIQLHETISSIESVSSVELVVMAKVRSANYANLPWIWAAVFSLLAFSLFMLMPYEFTTLKIYFETVLVGALAFGMAFWATPTQRWLANEKEMRRNVEIMARALFQKAGMHRTRDGVGVLVFLSQFEKMAYVVADKGAQASIAAEDWEAFRQTMEDALRGKAPGAKVLEAIRQSKLVFAQQMPILPDDENELPNDLDVEL